MLVVDHLHEWSLGVWKATFAHIVRVLYAAVPDKVAVHELNARYVSLNTHSEPHSLYHQLSADP